MTNKRVRIFFVWIALLVLALPAKAQQRFFNLTADEVKVDSVLPHFLYSIPLPENYQDSVYTVSVKYPEYMDMTVSDVANYNRISGAALPSQVPLSQNISVSRRKGYLVVSFCPLVFRNNKYQMLVSFMLDVKAKAVKNSVLRQRKNDKAYASAADIYAEHSLLASGKWAKIRVSSSGVYQLTDATVRQAGFSNINKVKIYGYGGNLQNEALYANDLARTDDLKEVPQCVVGGKHLFYAKGPVSWTSNSSTVRRRNPYSDYGYYFITQSDEEPATVDSATFVSSFYPSPDDYHSLYEVDGYSWYNGGRNLFDPTPISVGGSQQVVITNTTGSQKGRLTVNVSAGGNNQIRILLNGKELGTLNVPILQYCKAGQVGGTYSLDNLRIDAKDTVTIVNVSGETARLDYVSMAWEKAIPLPNLSGSHPAATYVKNIANQDLHADGQADLVIIIPASRTLLKQAQRLKEFHESHDGMRVNIVAADQLYNEFSSGTPDANAYRRYLRMLQDRAATEADMPKYLLLFGDCVWDNRMLTADCKRFDPDDYLLVYESENSFSETVCYAGDSWMGILAEGAGSDARRELQDVGVGRFPVTTVAEAKIMVDKTINYSKNQNGGAWQNTIMFMGDDGNDNIHMKDVDSVANSVGRDYPNFLIKKVMWDAYTRESSATGNTYPEVSKIIRQQQANGALVMDYGGHGNATLISHESVLGLSDFSESRTSNLPLWVTAACDIMPFDGVTETIGESAVLNEKGGAVAFYGTARSVFTSANKYINHAFMKRVLSLQDGKPIALGEAHRLAQNDVMLGTNRYPTPTRENPNKTSPEQDNSENHLQYSLLGDPALSLNLPTAQVVVDEIDGVAVGSGTMPTVKAGSVIKMKGHVAGVEGFNGVVTATVRDTREEITCKLNNTSGDGAEEAFKYLDRTKTLYHGSDSIRNSSFELTFAVPKDINYADGQGMINLYALNTDKTIRANGSCDQFIVGGSAEAKNDSVGPSIYCYLNSPSFVDGGNVNSTPYFVAEIKDKDGINAAGSGIGHDLQLVIDGDMAKTYTLNNNFSYDFGTYTSGSTFYSIPELEEGPHRLQFRAWDIQNNSSTAVLHFNVVKGLRPQLFNIGVTNNPARTSTTFIISHDRMESNMDVVIELFDAAGRQIWRHAESGVSATGNYTVDWDLSVDGGRPLQTGVYLYRVKVSSEGSSYVSKTKKLIVISNR
ncbi:MAG: type IX secretion system sortase PorU [Prevotella sp.]|nr:type IX secretion system sortase PorU [Prevotella sp.]